MRKAIYLAACPFWDFALNMKKDVRFIVIVLPMALVCSLYASDRMGSKIFALCFMPLLLISISGDDSPDFTRPFSRLTPKRPTAARYSCFPNQIFKAKAEGVSFSGHECTKLTFDVVARPPVDQIQGQ